MRIYPVEYSTSKSIQNWWSFCCWALGGVFFWKVKVLVFWDKYSPLRCNVHLRSRKTPFFLFSRFHKNQLVLSVRENPFFSMFTKSDFWRHFRSQRTCSWTCYWMRNNNLASKPGIWLFLIIYKSSGLKAFKSNLWGFENTMCQVSRVGLFWCTVLAPRIAAVSIQKNIFLALRVPLKNAVKMIFSLIS